MPDTSNSTMRDPVLQGRAEFRAFLGLEGSPAEAGRLLFRRTGDAAAACTEMLRDHLTVSFMSTQAVLDQEFMGAAAEGARERARVELALQRAAILLKRDRLLQALAERDDTLQFDMAKDEKALARPDLDESTRADLENNLKVARVCRADLAALARVVLEQTAMREAAPDGPNAVFTEAELERLVRVAEERVAPVLPALERRVPLRRALATDLASEAIGQEGVAAAPSAEMSRKSIVR